MRGMEGKVNELLARVARLERELARVNSQTAKPKQSRRGIWLGKTDSSISKGANGTVSIYGGTALSEADTTLNVTATNKFANVGGSKWVVVAFIHGIFYIIAAEC